MAAPSVHFPNGRYYALTWSIPDSYGGMTSTLLHRSRAFRELGGVSVEVLTLDDRPDYAELSARLRESGELIDGVRIRNLWDDLRRRELKPAKKQKASVKPAPQLSPTAGDEVVEQDGVVLVRKRRDAHDRVVGIDRFRRDGSLLATERYGSSGRSIVLYGADGSAIRGWSSRWKLYRWWLDLELGFVRPRLIVALGATAALALCGKAVTVSRARGPADFNGRPGFITVHPSFLLRLPGAQAREAAFAAFVADLGAARSLASA